MNVILDAAMAAGERSSAFSLLLRNYGIWSRYFGCTGYVSHSSTAAPTAAIDDDTAMLVESAVLALKRSRPNVYHVFRLFYVRDMTPADISTVIRHGADEHREHRHRKTNCFEYSAALDDALRHITPITVCDLLRLAEAFLYNRLSQLVDGSLSLKPKINRGAE